MKKSDANTKIEDLIAHVRLFLKKRDWEKYQNPKDLAESVCIEAAELLQIFQWSSPGETAKFRTDRNKMTRIKEELADVVIYCLGMANTLKIDLTSAIIKKLEANEKKYPIKQCKGKTP